MKPYKPHHPPLVPKRLLLGMRKYQENFLFAGDLEEVPSPRVGFLSGTGQTFDYQSFGTGYILEFSAPRWIQCAYNPPWADDLSEEERAELEADDVELGGAWSCPSKPPELW